MCPENQKIKEKKLAKERETRLKETGKREKIKKCERRDPNIATTTNGAEENRCET